MKNINIPIASEAACKAILQPKSKRASFFKRYYKSKIYSTSTNQKNFVSLFLYFALSDIIKEGGPNTKHQVSKRLITLMHNPKDTLVEFMLRNGKKNFNRTFNIRNRINNFLGEPFFITPLDPNQKKELKEIKYHNHVVWPVKDDETEPLQYSLL